MYYYLGNVRLELTQFDRIECVGGGVEESDG